MFGIGLPELILIMVVALIVVGPDKLPDLAKTLARQIVELKRAANSLKDSLNEDDDLKPWEKNPLELGQIEHTPPNRSKSGPENQLQDESTAQEENGIDNDSELENSGMPSSATTEPPIADETTGDKPTDETHVDDDSDIRAPAPPEMPEPTAAAKLREDEENKIKTVKAAKIDE